MGYSRVSKICVCVYFPKFVPKMWPTCWWVYAFQECDKCMCVLCKICVKNVTNFFCECQVPFPSSVSNVCMYFLKFVSKMWPTFFCECQVPFPNSVTNVCMYFLKSIPKMRSTFFCECNVPFPNRVTNVCVYPHVVQKWDQLVCECMFPFLVYTHCCP